MHTLHARRLKFKARADCIESKTQLSLLNTVNGGLGLEYAYLVSDCPVGCYELHRLVSASRNFILEHLALPDWPLGLGASLLKP
jgi:hypothetical protein